MNIGKEIIARTLKDGDAAPFVKSGFGAEWLKRDESAAVFEGQTARAWQFILRHLENHGRVPPRELFEREHPPVSFRLPTDPLKVSELTELAENETRRVIIQSAQVAIQDIWTRTDFQQGDRESVNRAARLIRDAHEQLQRGGRASKYRTATLDELLVLPEPESLIEGALDAGTVCMLSGPSGKGKSFVALDWSLCVASGRKWLGRPTRQGSVIYVAAEGYKSLGHRGRVWQEEFGKVPGDEITFVTEPVQIDEAGTAYLSGLIRETDADLLVIDTLARCTVGMEENSARDMGFVIDRLYRLRDAIEECGTTILVVHHSGYDTKRARGSSALAAGMDAVIDIQGDDPHQAVTLRCSKRKDGEAFRDITVRLREAGGSCVLEECPEPDGPEAGKGKPSMASLLDPETGQTVAEIAGKAGTERTWVSRQLNAMENAGKARREERRRGGHLWYRVE
ncbi:MAG: AAA family ATPase [Acidobacteriaceae bacterium]|nr:AAA family ATPase [Streptosporangiaceae bacterium]MBV9767265.1 AAA family ATPase [Acidobacteriaceae bacterium]